MKSIIIRNARLVNRGSILETDLLIRKGRLDKIAPRIDGRADLEMDANGKHVLPGIIDDQVHFREPGMTHKANIQTEARAAVAGGVTSFMEMPNTNPTSTTQERLEEKYAIAARTSLANYSFFMGTTNDNYDEVMRTDPRRVCGIKIFMGSSTGNMLVDDTHVLERVFANTPMLVATHCEDEATVRRNMEAYQEKYGEVLNRPNSNDGAKMHPKIRNVEACLLSSTLAVRLAKRHGTRLHILHISTKDELGLFDNSLPLEQKRITSEVCVHHLWFHAGDYHRMGNQIKCNPAIKSRAHRDALFTAMLDNRLDVIATDHAPHTWDEKSQPYAKAPAGLPLVQHSLNVMLEFYHAGKISLERIVEKMCHAPAIAFKIEDRGFLDEGAWADLSIVDLDHHWQVKPDTILYRCGWSPFAGKRFRGKVESTIVSGQLAWHNGRLFEDTIGQRLLFNR